MDKLINKVFLTVMAAFISILAMANGDDDKKSNSKKPHIKVENKKALKLNKSKSEDTLTYDEKAIDDTLTFDDKKNVDDTLIFADDEMNFIDKSKNSKSNNEFSLLPTEKTNTLNPVIYPNPSFGQSVIEVNTPESTVTQITITSQDGVLIKKGNTSSTRYDLKDLPAGNYIVTIQNGNELVQKILFVK
ncbi:MAG: T9SS type A sorting domain-containing protein [Bacteroidia bacterium]